MTSLIKLVAVAAFGLLGTTIACAQVAYPAHPIRMIVPATAGGMLDVTTRVIAQEMSQSLGQPIVVENKPGAEGLVGILAVKNSPADGYTILFTGTALAQRPATKLDPGYDLNKDFVGIGMVSRAPLLLVGTPNQPARNLHDFIAQAKSVPDTVILAHSGVGTSPYMAAALLLSQAGIGNLLQVSYKGAAAAMPDVLAGRVNAAFDGGNTSGPLIKEGRLRAFGISTEKRSDSFPDIPTIAEQGLPGYSFYVYFGLVARAGTPRSVLDRLNQALHVAIASEPARERFRKDGAEPGAGSAEDFTLYLRRDMLRTMKLASDIGLPKD